MKANAVSNLVANAVLMVFSGIGIASGKLSGDGVWLLAFGGSAFNSGVFMALLILGRR
jgi:hypothetical protein